MHLFVNEKLAVAVRLIRWQISRFADREWSDYIMFVASLEEQNLTIRFSGSVLLVVHPKTIDREVAMCFNEKALAICRSHFKQNIPESSLCARMKVDLWLLNRKERSFGLAKN